ncbi:hypothetical protein RO3G_14725 [Rhizopus delemar RA 99-880]|uniref:Uncharacterized protein n=1 Tax=Rhizopus delemar (strain RA 99-880 / ATCC MYA-4621 / FGSC 9543 / NRRL 43880) TaxID=246409 RepID=I1CNI4_RHIO9|nr:hypothetical protein RO3G_14725 [Rhizopus delemar RA 99-880]|eukprot:EIE90014.1 hypothetical protein RO3G_14725 [Rhizopus delemar RA 99-880]
MSLISGSSSISSAVGGSVVRKPNDALVCSKCLNSRCFDNKSIVSVHE